MEKVQASQVYEVSTSVETYIKQHQSGLGTMTPSQVQVHLDEVLAQTTLAVGELPRDTEAAPSREGTQKQLGNLPKGVLGRSRAGEVTAVSTSEATTQNAVGCSDSHCQHHSLC